jgi:DNA-binding LacI/PurR family transcriptional regulator
MACQTVFYAGSMELLQWFTGGDIPALAIYGRMNSVDMAGLGIIKSAVTKSLVEHLVETGHQRMVMLVLEKRRKPTPGLTERFFLEVQLDHERWIHRCHSPPYRAACWHHVRSLPGTRPWLEPQAAIAWFAQLLDNPDTTPRACQWKAK